MTYRTKRAYQLGRPIEITLTHGLTDTLVAGGRCGEKPTIATMTAAARVVRLDIKGAKTQLVPVGTTLLHIINSLDATDITQDHDGAKITKPVRSKGLQWQGVYHWISVAILDFFVEVVG